MTVEYPAQLERYGEDEIVVSFRDVPNCHTSGHDIEEALSEAADALDEAITGRINRGEPIPLPSAALSGEYMIALPDDTSDKAEAMATQTLSAAGNT